MDNQDPNKSKDPLGALLVTMAKEGKISPEAAGMSGEAVMPAMPQEQAQQQESQALPQAMPLQEEDMAEPRDISIDEMPEEDSADSVIVLTSLDDIDPALTMAVSYVESRDQWDAVSESDAVGIMQVKPKFAIEPGYGAQNIFEVAEEAGVDMSGISRDEAGARELLFKPEVNIEYGGQYLDALKEEFGDVEAALIAYNWGPGKTRAWIDEGRDKADLPDKVTRYLDKIERTLNGEDVYAASAD